MLQQILETMWVDPEILEELDEDQKQILFSKMRQEQLRKWRLREESFSHDEPDHLKMCQKTNSKSPKKSVRFLLNDEGEPLVVAIDDHNDCSSITDAALSVIYCNVNDFVHDNRYDYNSNRTGHKESRDILCEITANYSKRSVCTKVAQKIALWEKKVMDEQSQMITCKMHEDPTCDSIRDDFWNEKEKCASQTNGHKTLTATKEIVIHSTRPKNKAALLEWYRLKEIPRQAGITNNHFETWFHGYITRNEAENLLSDKVDGTFLVRLTESVWGYAITLKSLNKFKHYLIDASKDDQYTLLGSNRDSFPSLSSLVNHYSNNPLSAMTNETLTSPCPRNDHGLQTIVRSPNNFLIECQ